MTKKAAHTSYWETSDIVFGIPGLLALALQWLLPIALPYSTFGIVIRGFGIFLALIGVILIYLARRELSLHHQPADPGRPTTTLVSTGIFAISRNPLYLGAAIMLAGIAFVFNMPWVLIMLIVSIVACYYVLIAPEERYLLDILGDDYRAYTARVHRWFGRTKA